MKMKRCLAAGTAALLAARLAVSPALGAVHTYTLEEFGFSCTVPEEMSVFTRDMDPKDPLFDAYGISPESIADNMEGINAYLMIFDETVSYQITLVCQESTLCSGEYPYLNLAGLDETHLEEVFSYLTETISGIESVTMIDSEIRTFNGNPYFCFSYLFEQDGQTAYELDCMTLVDQRDYWFDLTSPEVPVTEEARESLEAILESCSYEALQAEKVPGISVLTWEAKEIIDNFKAEQAAKETESPAATTAPATETEPPAESLSPDTGDTLPNQEGETSSGISVAASTLKGLVLGLLVGLIPLIVGLVKKKTTLAWISFAVCAVTGALLGLLFMPVPIFFLVRILTQGRKDQKNPGEAREPDPPENEDSWN